MLSSHYVCTCTEPIRVEYEYEPDPAEDDDERRRTKKQQKNQQLFVDNPKPSRSGAASSLDSGAQQLSGTSSGIPKRAFSVQWRF